jgi:hypothetical protein
MSKRVGRYVIEHWRDDELVGRVELTSTMIERRDDGTCFVVFPPGTVILNTGDELHFDVDGLIERLMEVRSCPNDLDAKKSDTLNFDST